MKKFLIALIAILGLTFASAGNFSVYASVASPNFDLSQSQVAFGSQLGFSVADNTDFTVDATTDFSNLGVYLGVRQYIGEIDRGPEADRVYLSGRLGAFNPLDDLVSAPDTLRLALGAGVIHDGSLLQGDFLVDTDFSDVTFGVGLTLGVGAGW